VSPTSQADDPVLTHRHLYKVGDDTRQSSPRGYSEVFTTGPDYDVPLGRLMHSDSVDEHSHRSVTVVLVAGTLRNVLKLYSDTNKVYLIKVNNRKYTGRHLSRRSSLGLSYDVQETPCYSGRRFNRFSSNIKTYFRCKLCAGV